MHRHVRYILAAVLVLTSCDADEEIVGPPPATATCPAGMPAVPITCYRGQSPSGADYVIAMPQNWNGTLILFNRGATPVPLDSARVFGPARLLLADSVAVAATAYRSATPLARAAAEDVQQLRRVFAANLGEPRRVVVSGVSFGGLVTALCAEIYRTFHGAFAGCGLLAGGPRSYHPLLDIRVIYQFYCRNLPRAGEPQYDLFLGQGTPPLSVAEVRSRVNECTGISLPAAPRSAQQSQNLANILNVVRIPENYLLTNLEAANVLLGILVRDVMAGRNPVSNMGVTYSGSTDDAALNSGVARYAADAGAAARLAADDPTGRVSIPVVTLHAIDDGRAYVENEAAYRAAFQRAGTLPLLFQAYTNQGGHCQFTQPETLAMYSVLLNWIDTRSPPTQQELMAVCERYRTRFGGMCRFNATFQPAALETRMYSR